VVEKKPLLESASLANFMGRRIPALPRLPKDFA